ncbi:pyrimidine dimer DNA glycosylase [Candidatus Nomurabacteria bacterium]|nr:pyrimidine dimer DNA glycosylase [Candidatus Nomurabacteria bacterium]
MRVWDIHPKHLCRKHLLGEHRELHGLWNILTKHKGKGGYAHHPETKRWVGKNKALYLRHEKLVQEMTRRGYEHRSPLNKKWATGSGSQRMFIDSVPNQRVLLTAKPCECLLLQ